MNAPNRFPVAQRFSSCDSHATVDPLSDLVVARRFPSGTRQPARRQWSILLIVTIEETTSAAHGSKPWMRPVVCACGTVASSRPGRSGLRQMHPVNGLPDTQTFRPNNAPRKTGTPRALGDPCGGSLPPATTVRKTRWPSHRRVLPQDQREGCLKVLAATPEAGGRGGTGRRCVGRLGSSGSRTGSSRR